MTKIRVHEYAKRVKKTSKEIIDELGKINVSVTNHMSTIDQDAIAKLDKSYGGKKSKVTESMQKQHQLNRAKIISPPRTKPSSMQEDNHVRHKVDKTSRPASTDRC